MYLYLSEIGRYLPIVMAIWAAERAMNGFSSDQVWGTRFLLAIPLLVRICIASYWIGYVQEGYLT